MTLALATAIRQSWSRTKTAIENPSARMISADALELEDLLMPGTLIVDVSALAATCSGIDKLRSTIRGARRSGGVAELVLEFSPDVCTVDNYTFLCQLHTLGVQVRQAS